MIDRSISYSELKKIEKNLLYSSFIEKKEEKEIPNKIEDYWPTKSSISDDKMLSSSAYPNIPNSFPIIPQNFYSGAQVLGFLPGEKDNVLKGLFLFFFYF